MPLYIIHRKRWRSHLFPWNLWWMGFWNLFQWVLVALSARVLRAPVFLGLARKTALLPPPPRPSQIRCPIHSIYNWQSIRLTRNREHPRKILVRDNPRTNKAALPSDRVSKASLVLMVLRPPCWEQCVLPINIINEKIYVFLWFWFIILSSLTLLGTGCSHWVLTDSLNFLLFQNSRKSGL